MRAHTRRAPALRLSDHTTAVVLLSIRYGGAYYAVSIAALADGGGHLVITRPDRAEIDAVSRQQVRALAVARCLNKHLWAVCRGDGAWAYRWTLLGRVVREDTG